jgi:hypothetical protein
MLLSQWLRRQSKWRLQQWWWRRSYWYWWASTFGIYVFWRWSPRPQFWSTGFGGSNERIVCKFKVYKISSYTIFLMNLCIVHGISNKFVNELFALLGHHILLEPNILLTNYYATRTLIHKFGLNYKIIHACLKGCVLFWGEHKDVESCPKCGGHRYKEGVNKVLPMKVFNHFPIILKL